VSASDRATVTPSSPRRRSRSIVAFCKNAFPSPSAAGFAWSYRLVTQILYETLTEPGGRYLTFKEVDYEN
jgi:hypothetical protein